VNPCHLASVAAEATNITLAEVHAGMALMETRIMDRLTDMTAHFNAQMSEIKRNIAVLEGSVAAIQRSQQEHRVGLQTLPGRQVAPSGSTSSAASPITGFSSLRLGEGEAQPSAPSPAQSSNTSEQAGK
jgi:hypothetical protein